MFEKVTYSKQGAPNCNHPGLKEVASWISDKEEISEARNSFVSSVRQVGYQITLASMNIVQAVNDSNTKEIPEYYSNADSETAGVALPVITAHFLPSGVIRIRIEEYHRFSNNLRDMSLFIGQITISSDSDYCRCFKPVVAFEDVSENSLDQLMYCEKCGLDIAQSDNSPETAIRNTLLVIDRVTRNFECNDFVSTLTKNIEEIISGSE